MTVSSFLSYFAIVPSVTESCNFVIGVRVTTCASVGCITLCFASRISYNIIIIVTESINFNGSSGDLNVTNCTINYVIVRAFFCTIRINFVFNYSLTSGVTERINVCINVGVAASTSVSGITLLGTSRIGNICFISMFVLDRRNNCFFSLVASAANAVLETVGFFGSFCIYDPFTPSVTESRYFGICVCIVTNRTCVSCITLCCTSRISYNIIIIVTESINFNVSFGELFFTNRTVNYVVVRTFFCTIRINVVFNNSCACNVICKLTVFFSAKVANCLVFTSSFATLVLTFSGSVNCLNVNGNSLLGSCIARESFLTTV